jgi:hypothetical protein
MNATYAQVCEISLFFTLTDRAMDLRVANFTVPLRPDVLKLSVIFDCPWESVLLNQNLSFAQPSDTRTLYARFHEIGTRMVFKFATQIINFPKLEIGNLNDVTPPYGIYIQEICLGQRPEIQPLPDGRYPVQPVASTFNFLAESGILIPSEDFAASMYFLGWSLSDDIELGRIIAGGDVSRANASVLDGYVSMPYNLSIPFANRTC